MNRKTSKDPADRLPSTNIDSCCGGNPFHSLPAEIQPRGKSWKDQFRQVACPECQAVYWVDREVDLETELCLNCS